MSDLYENKEKSQRDSDFNNETSQNVPEQTAFIKEWQSIEYYFYNFEYKKFASSFLSFWDKYYKSHEKIITKKLVINLILQHIGLFNYQIYFDYYEQFISTTAEHKKNIDLNNLLNQLILVRIQIQKYNVKYPLTNKNAIKTVPNMYTFIRGPKYQEEFDPNAQCPTFDLNLLYCCDGVSLNEYNQQYLIGEYVYDSDSDRCNKNISLIGEEQKQDKQDQKIFNIIDHHFRFMSNIINTSDKNDRFSWYKQPETRVLHSAMLLSQIYPFLSKKYIDEILDISNLNLNSFSKNDIFQMNDIRDTLLLFLQTMKCFLKDEIGDRFAVLLLFFTVAYTLKNFNNITQNISNEDVFYQFYSIQTIDFNMNNYHKQEQHKDDILYRIDNDVLMIKTIEQLPTKYQICKNWHLHSNIYQYLRDQKIGYQKNGTKTQIGHYTIGYQKNENKKLSHDSKQNEQKEKIQTGTKTDLSNDEPTNHEPTNKNTHKEYELFLSNLKTYFIFLDQLYLKEFERTKPQIVDSNYFQTLNYNFAWSSTEKAYFTNQGIWVGPYEIKELDNEAASSQIRLADSEGKPSTNQANNNGEKKDDIKLYLGRILFRTRKLREWNFHYCILKTELVIEKSEHSLESEATSSRVPEEKTNKSKRYWLKYEIPEWLKHQNFGALNKSEFLYRLQLTTISSAKIYSRHQQGTVNWTNFSINLTKLMIAKLMLGIGNNKLKSEVIFNYQTFSFFATNLSFTRTVNSYIPNSNDHKMDLNELQQFFGFESTLDSFLHMRKLLYGEILSIQLKHLMIRWRQSGMQSSKDDITRSFTQRDISKIIQKTLSTNHLVSLHFQSLLKSIQNDQELGSHLQKLIPFVEKKLFFPLFLDY